MPTTVITPASEAAGDGDHVVGVLADPDRVGPRLRHQQADDVAADDAEHPEVEQRAADPQQPVLVELGGPGGPAELVVAVAPPGDRPRRSSGTGRGRRRRGTRSSAGSWERRHGQQGGRGAAPVAAPGLNCGLANGASPTSSSGGPSAASRRTASRSSPRSGGSVAVTASIRRAHGEPMSRSERRSSSRPARWSSIRSRPQVLVHGGGELEDDAEVVGQLGVVELEPGREVGLLEPQQRHPALAGVAVGEVGQEQVAAAAGVEGLDVVGLELRQRRGLEVVQEGPDGVPDRGRQTAGTPTGCRSTRASRSSSG